MAIDIDWLRRATNALYLELPKEVADDYCPRVHAVLSFVDTLDPSLLPGPLPHPAATCTERVRHVLVGWGSSEPARDVFEVMAAIAGPDLHSGTDTDGTPLDMSTDAIRGRVLQVMANWDAEEPDTDADEILEALGYPPPGAGTTTAHWVGLDGTIDTATGPTT